MNPLSISRYSPSIAAMNATYYILYSGPRAADRLEHGVRAGVRGAAAGLPLVLHPALARLRGPGPGRHGAARHHGQHRGGVLGAALRQAAAGDRVRAPVQQRHHAHREPLQELQLLLGLRGLHRVPPEPPALHQPRPAPGPLLPRLLPRGGARQPLHPPPPARPQTRGQQGEEDPQTQREPHDSAVQTSLLSKLHL